MLLENVSSTLTSRITRFHQFIWLTVLTGLQTSSLALLRLFWDAEHHQSAGRSSCNDFHFPRNGTLFAGDPEITLNKHDSNKERQNTLQLKY